MEVESERLEMERKRALEEIEALIKFISDFQAFVKEARRQVKERGIHN